MLLYKPTGAVHPNVSVVMEGHLRLERGDNAAIAAMFSPTIKWHEFGVVQPTDAVYSGVDAVMGFWKRYFAAAGPNFRQDIVSIMANDEYVSSIVRLTGSKGDLKLATNAIDLMLMESGLIAEFWRYYDDLEAIRKFFDA